MKWRTLIGAPGSRWDRSTGSVRAMRVRPDVAGGQAQPPSSSAEYIEAAKRSIERLERPPAVRTHPLHASHDDMGERQRQSPAEQAARQLPYHYASRVIAANWAIQLKHGDRWGVQVLAGKVDRPGRPAFLATAQGAQVSMLIVVDDADVVVIDELIALASSSPGQILVLSTNRKALIESTERPERASLEAEILRSECSGVNSATGLARDTAGLVVKVLVVQSPAPQR